MHRPPVHLGVHPEVVAQDPVRPHGLYPELVVGDPQRLAQLGPDHLPPGGVPPQHVAQVLRPDHRLPWPRQFAQDSITDLDRHGPADRPWRRRDRLGQRPGRRPVGDRRDRVVPDPARLARRVGVRAARHRQHVPAAVIKRLERPVGRLGAIDQVPGRPRDRIPVQRDVPAARHRAQPGRRRQLPAPVLVPGQAPPPDPPFPIGSRRHLTSWHLRPVAHPAIDIVSIDR